MMLNPTWMGIFIVKSMLETRVHRSTLAFLCVLFPCIYRIQAGLTAVKFFRFVVVAFCLVVNPVAAQDLSVEIASNHIDITVGFTGSTIEVFGDRRDAEADVAVFVIGPEKTITVWSKAQVLGAWVNFDYAQFKKQPGYYNYTASFEDMELPQNKDVMLENRIGLEGLFQHANIRMSADQKEKQRFIDALVSRKQFSGVYPEEAAMMKFMNPHFFRASFDIPAGAPTGEYKIHSFLIKDGKVIEGDIDVLRVEQVGLNAFVLKAAEDHSVLYAIVCILIAAFAGWLVSAVRVKP